MQQVSPVTTVQQFAQPKLHCHQQATNSNKCRRNSFSKQINNNSIFIIDQLATASIESQLFAQIKIFT